MANPRRAIDAKVQREPKQVAFSRGLRLNRVGESADGNGQWCCSGSFDARVYLDGDLTASEALRLGRWHIAVENYLFRLLQPFGVMPVANVIGSTESIFGPWNDHPRSRAQLIANFILLGELEQIFGKCSWIQALRANSIKKLDRTEGGALRAAKGLPRVKCISTDFRTWVNLAMGSNLYRSIGEAAKDAIIRPAHPSGFPIRPYPGLCTIGAPLPVPLAPANGRQPGWFIGVWEQTTFVWIYTEDVNQVAWKYQVFQVLQHPVIPLDQLRRSA